MKITHVAIELKTDWKDKKDEKKKHKHFAKEIKDVANMCKPYAEDILDHMDQNKNKLTIKVFEVDTNVQKRKKETGN